MASMASNKLKFLLANKVINFAAGSDVFKIILMQSGFSFDIDAHHSYADVSGQELLDGNGYSRNSKVLGGVSVYEDDTDNRCEITWNPVTWVATGGDIGPTPGAIIFDSTVEAPTANPIIGYIDFGGNQTQSNGGTATISNIEVRIA